jgi:hypothetical protein
MRQQRAEIFALPSFQRFAPLIAHSGSLACPKKPRGVFDDGAKSEVWAFFVLALKLGGR